MLKTIFSKPSIIRRQTQKVFTGGITYFIYKGAANSHANLN